MGLNTYVGSKIYVRCKMQDVKYKCKWSDCPGCGWRRRRIATYSNEIFLGYVQVHPGLVRVAAPLPSCGATCIGVVSVTQRLCGGVTLVSTVICYIILYTVILFMVTTPTETKQV